jgi:DNA mismatch repair protein MutS2
MTLFQQIDRDKLPQHIAIIMDGNGRWAKEKGNIRVFGHRSGVSAVRDIVEGAVELGIKYITVYAFSTENWNRPVQSGLLNGVLRQKLLKEKKLEETLARYESEMSTIDKQRKEITQKAKQEAQNLLSETNAKIENTIRQIKEAQAEKEKTKEVRKELENFREKLTPSQTSKDVHRERNPVLLHKKNKPEKAEPAPVQTERPLKQGSNVRLKGQTATGVILEIQDKNAIVAFGQLKSTVKLTKLEAISNAQVKKEKHRYEQLGETSNDEVRQRKLSFKSEIDVRGMRGDEALQAVTYFIDDAVMVGVASVRILHGTGTGALRQMIRQYLGTVNGVRTYRDEHVQFGGAGITVIEFN